MGRRLYNKHCYFCHGYNGDAATLAARFLVPPPVDFTAADSAKLTRQRMLKALKAGRPGTAMQSFAQRLSEPQMQAVVDYVRDRLMSGDAGVTRYHSPENGWLDHDRYSAAFPFALGEIPLDTPVSMLTPAQQAGRHLYMNACVSCHDRGRVMNEGAPWETDAVSFPRPDTVKPSTVKTPSPTGVDAVSGATPYARHEQPPATPPLTGRQRQGRRLFQANCAFCHAADGSGGHWIGSFLKPHPRNLNRLPAHLTGERLKTAIANGVPGTAMPAWKTVLSDDQIDAVADYIETVFVGEASLD